ncbi:hypothetical protein [Paludibacterium yongneupense]|uniref:hypothetical protein n=1 Tax=Paludibacterium yongneupense TaxID=400061 RepID=UPI000429E2FB|nr:hypothetical protein [Paludibacterium yongneupense]
MEFNDMAALAFHFAKAAAREPVVLENGLEKCAVHIEGLAKDEIGHYQSSVGPFPAWAELADSPEQQKAAHGYPVDAPLLASGEMREAITHEVSGFEAAIGVKDDDAGKKLIYHELGTSKMPAQPVLGPAAFRGKEFIIRTIGHAAVSGMIGGEQIHSSPGYEGK